MAEKIQRHALGSENAARRTRDRGDDIARPHARAIRLFNCDGDGGIDQLESKAGEIEAGDNARLTRGECR